VSQPSSVGTQTAVLDIMNVSKEFHVPGGGWRGRRSLQAVNDVSITIGPGETLGLVGESGSGKSTLARMVVGLTALTGGTISINGVDIASLTTGTRRRLSRSVQMVFQDPYSSFDPLKKVSTSVVEPLLGGDNGRQRATKAHAVQLFEMVGLDGRLADRYPSELSGGQLQRAAIARALSVEPTLLVLDEPVSALDVSTQAQIVNLLEDLQERLGTAYLFVAHDLAIVRHISDRIAVMYCGSVVEEGPTEDVYERPAHPYTLGLISSIPTRGRKVARLVVKGELPSPLERRVGCSFRTRCPWAMPICTTEQPPVVATPGKGHAACHLHTVGPELRGETVITLRVKPGVA
jgi:oligopeptide/dipeptide ABC transporter ATP-binding protein